jgi:hypothetical protein
MTANGISVLLAAVNFNEAMISKRAREKKIVLYFLIRIMQNNEKSYLKSNFLNPSSDFTFFKFNFHYF